MTIIEKFKQLWTYVHSTNSHAAFLLCWQWVTFWNIFYDNSISHRFPTLSRCAAWSLVSNGFVVCDRSVENFAVVYLPHCTDHVLSLTAEVVHCFSRVCQSQCFVIIDINVMFCVCSTTVGDWFNNDGSSVWSLRNSGPPDPYSTLSAIGAGKHLNQ